MVRGWEVTCRDWGRHGQLLLRPPGRLHPILTRQCTFRLEPDYGTMWLINEALGCWGTWREGLSLLVKWLCSDPLEQPACRDLALQWTPTEASCYSPRGFRTFMDCHPARVHSVSIGGSTPCHWADNICGRFHRCWRPSTTQRAVQACQCVSQWTICDTLYRRWQGMGDH